MFINSLARKVEETGGQLVQVNPRNTIQICSSCGEITKEKLKLSQRKFKCYYCENELDRDINSAINILQLAENRFGASLRV